MNIADRYHFNEADHIHTLDGKPLTGTSSVMAVLSKPLTYWASGLAVAKLGWTNPKFVPDYKRISTSGAKKDAIAKMSEKEYLALLDEAYHAHSKSLKSSAGKGKDLHKELEDYVTESINVGQPIIQQNFDGSKDAVVRFSEWAIENVEKFLWSELHTYSEKLWLGGITDCGALMKDGSTSIIDFKSSKDAYVSQALQIGGYSKQIIENGAFTRSGEQVIEPMKVDKFIVIPFGAPEFKVVEFKDTNAYENGFVSALNLYRLTNEHEKNL